MNDNWFMRGTLFLILISACCFLSLGQSALAEAEIFGDDFEDGDASDWDFVTAITPTAGSEPVWTVASAILSQITATTDVSRPQAMALAPAGIVENPHITVDVRCDNSGQYEDVGVVFAYKPDGGQTDDIFYVDMAFDRIFAAIGNINTTPGAPAANRVVLQQYIAPDKDLYVTQTWAQLDVILDSTAGTLLVMVDNVVMLDITSAELIGIKGRVGVCSVNDNVSFDNFSVEGMSSYAPPEITFNSVVTTMDILPVDLVAAVTVYGDDITSAELTLLDDAGSPVGAITDLTPDLSDLENPTATFTADTDGIYKVMLEVFDGTTYVDKIAEVVIYADPCQAKKDSPSGWTANYYDRNEDCIVNLEDLALFAEQWLK